MVTYHPKVNVKPNRTINNVEKPEDKTKRGLTAIGDALVFQRNEEPVSHNLTMANEPVKYSHLLFAYSLPPPYSIKQKECDDFAAQFTNTNKNSAS